MKDEDKGKDDGFVHELGGYAIREHPANGGFANKATHELHKRFVDRCKEDIRGVLINGNAGSLATRHGLTALLYRFMDNMYADVRYGCTDQSDGSDVSMIINAAHCQFGVESVVSEVLHSVRLY